MPARISSRLNTTLSPATTFAGISTDDTLLWGFGLENVADRAKRKSLVFEAMKHLGVNPYTSTTGTAGGSVPATLSLTLGLPQQTVFSWADGYYPASFDPPAPPPKA